MYNERKILIFFDGFDEMAARVDSTVIESNLIEIDKFAKEIGNVIVTCRPEYFISDIEENRAWRPKNDPIIDRMANYVPIELNLWDNEQVTRYIEKKLQAKKEYSSLSIKDFMDTLERVSKSDISSRAVHLDIAIKILPYLLENNVPLSRANLYKSYINNEFDREIIKNKRLRIISDEQRLELLKEVAYKSFLKLSKDLDFETATQIIKLHINVVKHEIDSITRDFLNRSFLSRSGDLYRFGHTSLYEYLIATKIFDLIHIEDFSFLENNQFSPAVSGITLELFGGFDKFLYLVDKFQLDNSVETNLYYKKILFLGLCITDLLYSLGYEYYSARRKADHDMISFRHDIKNTATWVVHLSYKLQSLGGSPSEKDKGDIQKTWNKIVDRFVWMGSLKSNNISIKLLNSEINLIELLHDSIPLFSETKVEITGKCSSFVGDKVILSRIFDNLISNAIEEIRAIGKNDTLFISIQESLLPQVHEVNLVFSNKIRPNTIPDFLKDIFTFGYTTKKEGRGYGLFAVKSLVALHNGLIDVTMKNGVILFNITLKSLE